MRWDNLFVAGIGTYLPPKVSAAEAVAAGRYAADEHEENQLVSALESDSLSAPEMAVLAGRRALERFPADDIDLVLHACMYHQGQDFWTPAAYVQRHTVGGRVPAIRVDHASNSGMAALELAASWLCGRDARAALITTGDRYALPGFDRWSSDSGQVYSDGAAALVLSRRGGLARLLATHSLADPELEDAYRDVDAGFSLVPHASGAPLNLRGRTRAFMQRAGYQFFAGRMRDGLVSTVDAALQDAGTTMDGIARVVVPNAGRKVLERGFLAPLKIDVARTVWDWGRHTCHIGAGDQFAGLAHLVESGQVRRGDQVLLVGVGIGFSWTAAVVSIGGTPRS